MMGGVGDVWGESCDVWGESSEVCEVVIGEDERRGGMSGEG